MPNHSLLYATEIDSPIAIEFQEQFNVTFFEGQKHYKRLKLSPVQYVNHNFPTSIADMETHSETGIAIEMTRSAAEIMMELALEGLAHKRFRNMHPGARELYDQYRMMYLLANKS